MTTAAPLAVAIPLATAAVVLFAHFLLPRGVVRVLTLVGMLAEMACAAVLLHQARSSTVVYWFGGWKPRGGMPLGVSFAVDQVGAGAALLAGVIASAAVVTARRTMGDVNGIVHALFLTLLAAMAGFSLTGDLFNMFVFFELMAVSAFALAAFHTGSLTALRSALSFAITNGIGAFLVLIGIAMLYARTGTLNLAQMGRTLQRAGAVDRLVVVAFALVIVGFLIKAAVVPFHFWLIDTVGGAPLPLVMVLAGVLDTLGVYGVARVYWAVFAGSLGGQQHPVQWLLIAIGALSALLAGVCSVPFREPRTRLAFVMVAHTGIVLIGVGCLTARGAAGAATYAVGDGAVKAALFTGIALLGLSGPSDVRDPSRVSPKRRAVGLAILGLGGLAIAGLPVFATGVGKVAIEDAARAAGYPWVTPVIVVTAVLTGAAVLDITRTAGPVAPRSEVADADSHGWGAVGAAGACLLAISALAAPAGRWASSAAARFTDTAAYQQRVLTGVGASPGRVPAEALLPTRGMALDLLCVAGAVGLAVALRRQAPRRVVSAARSTRAWAAVRRLHDGSISDAATWTTIGTAAIALALVTNLH